MADFSHLLTDLYPPDLVARFAAEGEEVTDEILLEIFNRIFPPLLGLRETAVVVAILSRKRGRRPCRGVPSLRWLSRHIAELDRSDVHESFIRALSKRIGSPKGFTEIEYARRFNRRWKSRDRRCIIRGLYRCFYRRIQDDPPAIRHQVLGEIQVPLSIKGRSARAAEMTHDVLRKMLKMRAPDTSTIIKIGSMRH